MLWWIERPERDLPLDQPLELAMPVLFYPVLEEIVFRGLLQGWLRDTCGPRGWGPLSPANMITSLLFTALHFLYHPPLWAALVIFPSLVFGYFQDRHRHLAAPVILHVFYNSGYYGLFGLAPTLVLFAKIEHLQLHGPA